MKNSRAKELLDKGIHSVTEETPLSVSSLQAVRENEVHFQEWWYVFVVQFLLWWALWSAIDSVPDWVGLSLNTPFEQLRAYLFETLVGALVYMVPFPWSIHVEKIKDFFGLVVLCCGWWGLLDTMANLMSPWLSKPLVYGGTLAVAGYLGILHHTRFRANYLLERLI